jgi:uncharacterized protein YggE
MRTLTVTGHGNARVAPDIAIVRVAAVHIATGVAGALAGVDAAVETISSVSRRHTESASVSSTGLELWPSHDLDGRPSGFEARHVLSITCPSLAAAGSLVAALADEVGDRLRVDGVSLAVGDSAEAEHAAREVAFQDARVRAEHLAGLAGVTLGEVQSVTAGGLAGPAGTTRAAKLETTLEPGEMTVGAAVTVTWQLV